MEVRIGPESWGEWQELGGGMGVRAFAGQGAECIGLRRTPEDREGRLWFFDRDRLLRALGQWVSFPSLGIDIKALASDSAAVLHVRRHVNPAEEAKRVHWKHLQNSARRHARERGHRMAIVAQRWEVRGHTGWHYMIVDATSAARVRSFRG